MNGLQAITQRRIDAYWRTIPDTIRIPDALAMPFGGERNLVLRKALGISLESGDVAMATQADAVQVVTDTRKRADRHAGKLTAALPTGWQVTTTRRPDRQWLIAAHP